MNISITVGGSRGVVELWDDAPRSVQALLDGLPIATELRQCRWSGDACFADVEDGPLAELDGAEVSVVSIYPGTLVLRVAEEVAPAAELLLGYGDAEHRWPTGPKLVALLGEITEGRKEILDELRNTAVSGPVALRLSREAAQ
jgi:hypothetical protein